MTHSIEDRQQMRRDLAHELRQAANCVEKGKMEQAKHHKDIACQDWQYLEIEAASGACEVE